MARKMFFIGFRNMQDVVKSSIPPLDADISRLPKLDQGSPLPIVDEKEIRDEESLRNLMIPVLITPLLLSKKRLLFEQCSKGNLVNCNVPLLEDLLREIGPNVRNELGETPLAVALKKLPRSINHVVFETLIKNGADAMTQYEKGRRALADIIFYYGDQRVISAYLPYHKQLDAVVNNLGETALHILAFRKGPNLVKYLLKRNASPDIKDLEGKTALHVAVERRSPKIVDILISFGANINAQCKEGLTPLHYACGIIDNGCIDILLKHKCNVNVQDAKRRTPLFHFVKCPCNQNSLLQKLFNAGCKIKGAAKRFRPLHMLATECIFTDNAVKYAKILIQRGADVNAINGRACTALHLAARFSTEKFVKCLFENGASYNGYTLNSKTPLDIALRWKQHDIVIHIMKTVSMHIYQRKIIIRKISTIIETTPNLRKLHGKLRRELIILSIRDSLVSYMDIYRADWSTLFKYTKNQQIVAYVDKLEAENFPFYGKDIKKKFREALRRRKCVESGVESLSRIFRGRLPYLCLKHMVQYLPTEDLEMLKRM